MALVKILRNSALAALGAAAVLACVPAHALLPDGALAAATETLRAAAAAVAPAGARIEVAAGTPDARLQLAPCERVEPYLPPLGRAWGRTRVGLRCVEGAVRWNVFVPMTVKVWAPALVGGAALPAGAAVDPATLRRAEVDWAAEPSPVVTDADDAAGRTLVRALAPGEPLRQAHLRQRQWFAAGDTVKIVAQGAGFAVSGEGQALTNGVEGQPARVRTEGGRIVTGRANGDRRIEVPL